ILSNSYRKLSGIYEFADRGSSLDEIAELVGYNKSHVELALRDRSSLEPRVINRLRILYNKEDLNKPYRISIS
ncbi:hypothetical protein HY498_01355, partial [Candidatus Woesearchaeota archaeon]|nr:hypothetical protein [Candidatus Woesearchaeota archaeon]